MTKRMTLQLAALLLVAFGAHAECPSRAGDESLATLSVSRGHLLTFPVASHGGDAITHRGRLWACVYDKGTKAPIAEARFHLIPFKGKVEGRGPERDDLVFFNPGNGSLATAGKVLQVVTSSDGVIAQRGLLIGSYALVPEWEEIAADEITVEFKAVSTLAAELSIGQLSSIERPNRE